jgi:hypothetical protein
MGTPAAPRIDARLRQYIAGSPASASPAEVTRAVGELAWKLGLTRPSYQQVRELMGGARRAERPVASLPRSTTRVALAGVSTGLDFLYQYPGPGLADWYERYKRGGA